MSNPQLQSNAASALLATINESPNTQHNSYVYSETDAIVPQTSMSWDNLTTQSGDNSSLGSLHWDISKNGYLTKMVLGLRFKVTSSSSGGSETLHPNWAMNCIHEITVSSGGRTIQRMTRENLLSHISDMPYYVQGAYVSGTLLKSSTTASPANSTNKDYDFFLNIPGFWEKNKTALNTSFLQPLRVTVRFANFANVTSSAEVVVSLVDLNTRLYTQYRNLQDPIDSATIQSNFGDGLLSQLITTFSQENAMSIKPPTQDVEAPYVVELKETSCVESMYIMVMREPEGGAVGTSQGQPLKINNIAFSSNGNNYVDVPASMLQLYGTQSVHGSKGFGSTNWENENSVENGGCKYIYKIDFGQGDVDSNILSNLLSFRELAAPKVTIKFAPDGDGEGKAHNIYVTYKRSELSNTVSSNGRFQIALSN
jgi:hypothetical protein